MTTTKSHAKTWAKMRIFRVKSYSVYRMHFPALATRGFREQKVPYVIFSHFCCFAVVVVESSENKYISYTRENRWFHQEPSRTLANSSFYGTQCLKITEKCALEFHICLTLSFRFPFTPWSIFIKSSPLANNNDSLLQVYHMNF